MLGTLKTLFKKEEIIATPELEDYVPEPASNPNFLTDQKKICQLLKNIEEASPLCTIIFKSSDQKFSSSILDVQLENNQIILDELIPPHGNNLMVRESNMSLSTIYNGIHLSFKLDNIDAGSSRGIAYYKTIFPSRIYYPQRRSSPRIQITSLNIPFSGMSQRTQASIGGLVFDLSRGGVCITSPNNIARFQRGDLLRNCSITLDNQTIDFDLSVRFIKKSNQGSRKTLVGGYFENIQSKGRNKIERFVAAIEREEIRNRKEQTYNSMLE